MAFKKDLNLTIFSQYKNLIDNYECYYSDNSLSKFIVHIPRINFNLEFFRIEDILITNLRPYCQFLHRDPISMQIYSTTKYQSKYNYKNNNIEVQHQNFVHKLSKDSTLKDSIKKITFGPTVISKRYPFSDSQHNEIYANIDEDQSPTKKTKKNKKIKYQINNNELPSNLITSKFKLIPDMTSKQVKNLDNVHRALQRLWYPSQQDLTHRMNSGQLINVDFSTADVRNYFHIFGPELAVLKGNTETEKYSTENLMNRIDITKQEILLKGDILFICSIPFLLIIAYPSAYSCVTHLSKGRDGNELAKYCIEIINWFKTRKLIPKILNFDSEPGIEASKSKIEATGCEVICFPHGVKVPEAENTIKLIKRKLRSSISTINYAIGKNMLIHLTVAAVHHSNLISRKSNPDKRSPHSIIFPGPIDFNHAYKFAPSDYVEVSADEPNQKNSVIINRTISAIPLYSIPGNLTRWKFFNIEKGSTFDRHHQAATLKPITNQIISIMNEYSKKEPLSTEDPNEQSLIIKLSNGKIIDDLPNEENILLSDEIISNDTIDTEISNTNTHHPEHSTLEEGLQYPGDAPGNGLLPNPGLPITGLSQDPGLPITGLSQEITDDDVNNAVGINQSSDVSKNDLNLTEFLEHSLTEKNKRTIYKNKKYFNEKHINTIYFDNSGYKRNVDLRTMNSVFSVHISPKKAILIYQKDGEEAIREEINGILSQKVFKGVRRQSLNPSKIKKIIRSSMFIKEKWNPIKKIMKLKARLVAGGHMQDRNLYTNNERSSPTVAISSFFTLISIAAAGNKKHMNFDFAQAFLNAVMKNEVHMIIDPLLSKFIIEIDETFAEFLNPDGTICVQLLKALYGCVESSALWYNHLKSILIKIGFKVNDYDNCVFTRYSNNGSKTDLCIHVDDGFACSDDIDDLKLLEMQLKKEFKSVEVNYDNDFEYLGMKINFDNNGSAEIKMEKYIDKVIQEFGNINFTAKTPAHNDIFIIDEDAEKLDKSEAEKFHRTVAQLLYLATRVRPDIMLAVIFLTSRVREPTTQDLKKLVRILCYLNGTKELGLILGGDKNGNIRLFGYGDAAFAIHPSSMKSHSGLILSVGRGIILAKSTTQKTVTKSSAESELVALSDLLSVAINQLEFMKSMYINIDHAELYQDNKSTIHMAENGKSYSDKTKHIKIKYFFIKQYIDSKEIKVTYCPTLAMVADILTKPLQGSQFLYLRDILLGYKHPDN